MRLSGVISWPSHPGAGAGVSWAQGTACPLDGECADRASQHQELQLPPPPYLPVSQPLLETQEKDPAGGQSPIRQEDLSLNFHPLESL